MSDENLITYASVLKTNIMGKINYLDTLVIINFFKFSQNLNDYVQNLILFNVISQYGVLITDVTQ